jgi:E3 ubiquitin-protein ligase RNF115/126
MFPFGTLSAFGGFETRCTGFGRDPHSPRVTGGVFMGDQPPNSLDLLIAVLNPGSGRHHDGDMIWSQGDFDSNLDQLAEQGNAAPPPASEAAIKALPKKKSDKTMFGENGKATCSICMDNVELGAEVMTLPCNHWFHENCVVTWLKEHETCPHCRQPITNQDRPVKSPGRRNSRRSSSVAGPYGADSSRDYPVPDARGTLRAARQRYYLSRDEPEQDHPPPPSVCHSEPTSRKRSVLRRKTCGHRILQ